MQTDETRNAGSNKPHPCGLSNLGNTCYINAALQSLGSVVPLMDYLAKDGLGDRGEMVKELHVMVQHMRTKSELFSPCKIKDQIAESNTRFGQTSQEDSQEFLQALIEKLHQCLRISVKSDAPTLNVEQDSTELEASEAAWHRYLNQHGESIVRDQFEGQLQSSMTCRECKKVTWKFDPLMFLPVPIPSAEHSEEHPCLLQDCLKGAFELQYFGGKEWYCSKCDRQANMERKPSISKLPNILMVYLKRFQTNYQSGERSKVNTNVTFPLRDFELSDVMSESAKSVQFKYTLIAVINHIGNITGGHYTAYGKHNNEWFCFDDSEVKCISEDRISSRYAYVLFYQKNTAGDHQQTMPKCNDTEEQAISHINNTHQHSQEREVQPCTAENDEEDEWKRRSLFGLCCFGTRRRNRSAII